MLPSHELDKHCQQARQAWQTKTDSRSSVGACSGSTTASAVMSMQQRESSSSRVPGVVQRPSSPSNDSACKRGRGGDKEAGGWHGACLGLFAYRYFCKFVKKKKKSVGLAANMPVGAAYVGSCNREACSSSPAQLSRISG